MLYSSIYLLNRIVAHVGHLGEWGKAIIGKEEKY